VLRFVPDDVAVPTHVGRSVAEELTDILASRGHVRVVSPVAALARDPSDDARQLAGDLGVERIVTGTVSRHGARVSLRVRVIEAGSGEICFTRRFEDESWLEVVRTAAAALDERLGSGAPTTPKSTPRPVPRAAVEDYLLARDRLREDRVGDPDGAVALLERALDAAPWFERAIALHAVAALRAWFLTDTHRPWREEAQLSIERALSAAPNVADTRLAAALHAQQYGRYHEALIELSRGLVLAPMHADLHSFVALLEMEVGRTAQARERLKHALRLEPGQTRALIQLARLDALDGDFDAADRSIAELTRLHGEHWTPLVVLRARDALWRGNLELLRHLRAHASPGQSAQSHLGVFLRYVVGDLSAATVEPLIKNVIAVPDRSPRLVTMVLQLMCEAHCVRGDLELATARLWSAADSALLDIDWLDRCPTLAPIRASADFANVRTVVAARVSELARVFS
jgi:serine/threonine-protein kinase